MHHPSRGTLPWPTICFTDSMLLTEIDHIAIAVGAPEAALAN